VCVCVCVLQREGDTPTSLPGISIQEPSSLAEVLLALLRRDSLVASSSSPWTCSLLFPKVTTRQQLRPPPLKYHSYTPQVNMATRWGLSHHDFSVAMKTLPPGDHRVEAHCVFIVTQWPPRDLLVHAENQGVCCSWGRTRCVRNPSCRPRYSGCTRRRRQASVSSSKVLKAPGHKGALHNKFNAIATQK